MMTRQHSRGFTLIEMIVSMVLLSFIAIIGYQGIVYSANQWQKGHHKMLFPYDHHQAINWIRLKVGAAEKVKSPHNADFAYYFNGNNQSIEFVSRYSRTRRGGLYVNKIEFDSYSEKIDVSYFLYHPDNLREASNVADDRVILLTNVRSVTFSYYGRNSRGQIGWYDSWTDTNSLPKMIRIDITNSLEQLYQSTIHIKTSNNV